MAGPINSNILTSPLTERNKRAEEQARAAKWAAAAQQAGVPSSQIPAAPVYDADADRRQQQQANSSYSKWAGAARDAGVPASAIPSGPIVDQSAPPAQQASLGGWSKGYADWAQPAPAATPAEPAFSVRGYGPDTKYPTSGKGVAGAAATGDTSSQYDWEEWAKHEWNYPQRGALQDPGTGETYLEKNPLPEGGTAKQQAWIDDMMKYGSLKKPDFDQFYKNAWQHSEGDINRQFAGRGLYNSSDALRALSHSRGDLAAQQSRDEADYLMKSWQNDVSRLATAAKLQGDITQADIDRWQIGFGANRDAQLLEEGRVRGGIEDTLGAARTAIGAAMPMMQNMLEADADLVMKFIMENPAAATNALNTDTQNNDKSGAALIAAAKLFYGGGGAGA